MPLSKIVRSENTAAVVFDFQPKQFPQSIGNEAESFIQREVAGTSDFRMNELIANKVGVAERLRHSLEEKVETLALEKLKEIQEGAYREAYDLGLKEGHEKAFQDANRRINDSLAQLGEVQQELENFKKELLIKNEAYFLKLIYLIASKIAVHEIKTNPDYILGVLQSVVEAAHGVETMNIKLAKADFDFVQEAQTKFGQEWGFLKKVRVEASDLVEPGGCVLESNYGVINASIEKRLEKAWEAIQDKLPKGHGLNDDGGSSDQSQS